MCRVVSASDQLAFMSSFVQYASTYLHAAAANWKPRQASMAARRRGAALALALRKLLSEGVELSSYPDTINLRRLLDALRAELSTNSKRAYNDKASMMRWLLRAYARLMCATFDFASVTVVQHFALFLGLEPDESTVKRYVAQARAELKKLREIQNKETLVRALTNRT